MTVKFADGIANILASSENYGENKTWILLRKKPVDLAMGGGDDGSEIEMEEIDEELDNNLPNKGPRRK